MHLWAGRTTHRLRRVDDEIRMSHKKVVLVNFTRRPSDCSSLGAR